MQLVARTVAAAVLLAPCAAAQIEKPPEFEEAPAFREAAPASLDSTSHVSARSEAVASGLVAQLGLFQPPQGSPHRRGYSAAVELVRQRNLAAAAAEFRTRAGANPGSLHFNAANAILLYLTGKHEESVAITLDLVRRFSRDARLIALLGETAAAAPSHLEKSVGALRQLATSFPNKGAARHYLAKLLAGGEAEVPAEAIALWTEAAQLDAADPRPCLELARAATADRPEEAIGWLQRALSRDPALPDAHYRLARLYARMGDTANANKHLTHYRLLR